MELKNIVLIALFVVIIAIVSLMILLPPMIVQYKEQITGNFSLQKFDRVSDVGYIIYTAQGDARLTLLTLKEKPTKKIFIIKDSGVEMTRFEEFIAELKTLDSAGYSTKIVNPFSEIKDGVIIIPTGAMPIHILEKLETINRTIFYIGAKDLIIDNGVKRQEWYNTLSQSTKERLHVIDTTVDKFLEDKDALTTLLRELLENNWITNSRTENKLSGLNRSYTETMNMKASNYMRAIWQSSNSIVIYDSDLLTGHQLLVNATPELFPGQSVEIKFDLKKSNGTVFVVIERNGAEILKDKWQRVSEGNVFIKSYILHEPGTYIIKVTDNSGVIGGTTTHVKDLQIKFIENIDHDYKFTVDIDAKPLKQGIVKVSLGDSNNTKEFFVFNGVVSVPAKIEKGETTFHFVIFDNQKDVIVENRREELFDIYLKYGLPGFTVMILVYICARLLKKPIYIIKTTDSAAGIRREMNMTVEQAIEIFENAHHDLDISGPITATEYAISLKKYGTEGAEITEANVEQVLKYLFKKGVVDAYGGYYQLAGKGDIKKNVLSRIIRDELIKKGIEFSIKGYKFITPYYEIGFFGEKFDKKAFIVFENESDIKSTVAKLNERERAVFSLQQYNHSVELVTKNKLGEIL